MPPPRLARHARCLPGSTAPGRAAAIVTVASAWLAGCFVALVAATPYLGDDGINKDIRAAAREQGTDLLGLITHYTAAWMSSEGRFFPGSLAWSYTLFWYAGSRLAYKVVVGLVVVAAVGAVALLVARLAGRWTAGALVVPVLAGLVQLRVGLDSVTSFAGLVPLTAGLCALAVLVQVSRRGWWWSLLAAVLYGAALVTYETVLLFAPAMIAVVVLATGRWRPALAIALPAAAQAAVVLRLRAALESAPDPAYTVNLDLEPVLRTFTHQLGAALPLAQWVHSVDGIPPITARDALLAALVAGVPVCLVMLARTEAPRPVPGRAIAMIALLGAWIWVSSAAIVSVSVRWQGELQAGEGYLSVFYGYVGLALCLVACQLAVERFTAGRSIRVATALTWAGALGVAVMASATFAGDLALVASL